MYGDDNIVSVDRYFLHYFNQITLTKFLQEHGIVVKATERKIEGVSEVDLVSHEHKIAIEFNGLYWHSESAGGINKNYHLNKTKSCMNHGIH